MHIFKESDNQYYIGNTADYIYGELLHAAENNPSIVLHFESHDIMVDFAYRCLLPYVIYQIVQTKEFFYTWINPTQAQHITWDVKRVETDFNNGFTPMASLAADISARGCIFPFFGERKDNDELFIFLGKHRWHALMNMDEPPNRNFFFLSHTIHKDINDYYCLIPKISIIDQTITFEVTNDSNEMAFGWMSLSDQIAGMLQLFNLSIETPSQFWNDPYAFELMATARHWDTLFLQNITFPRKSLT